jgi:hypothetical protein
VEHAHHAVSVADLDRVADGVLNITCRDEPPTSRPVNQALLLDVWVSFGREGVGSGRLGRGGRGR